MLVRLFDHAFRFKAGSAWHYEVIILDIVYIISHNSYYILAFASVIPSFFWIREFKDELRIKNLWQIVIVYDKIIRLALLKQSHLFRIDCDSRTKNSVGR